MVFDSGFQSVSAQGFVKCLGLEFLNGCYSVWGSGPRVLTVNTKLGSNLPNSQSRNPMFPEGSGFQERSWMLPSIVWGCGIEVLWVKVGRVWRFRGFGSCSKLALSPHPQPGYR